MRIGLGPPVLALALVLAASAQARPSAVAMSSPAGRWRAEVTKDAVRVDPGGVVLPGYPPPLLDGSTNTGDRHRRARVTQVAFDAAETQVASAGACYGRSGVTEPVTPSCAAVFVRVHRLADGSLVRALPIRWSGISDEQAALIMTFDAEGERLAVLTRHRWSDCSAEGVELELHVFRLADGARIGHRILSRRGASGTHVLAFQGEDVHVTTRRGARAHTRVIRMMSETSGPSGPGERAR